MSLYKNYTKNETGKKNIRTIIISTVLIFMALATLFPIYYMIALSFGAPVEAGTANYSLFPSHPTLGSYKFFFSYSKYSIRWILNSFIVATTVSLSNVIFATIAGYAFSKMKFKGSKAIFSVILLSMMIPYQVTQVPLYILIVNVLNIKDTYPALIIPSIVTAYNIFLAKQFIGALPDEILEAGRIEGCSQVDLLLKIVMPLSKTVMAVMAITTFLGSWNEFFWPFLVTSKDAMETMQVGLKSFAFANTTFFSPMMAGATISAIPMFILFFALQKYFLEGVTVGAVKG